MGRRVGLIHVDGKWPNLALMKISAWHKARGDEVEFYSPLGGGAYDLVCASKVFTSSPDYEYLPADCIKGGTGYEGNDEVLPPEVEAAYPDYGLYRYQDALGYTSRGCFRRCPWCVVWRREGPLRAVADIYDFWRGQSIIHLLDGNLLGLPDHFERVAKQIIRERVVCDFSQGLDVRLMTPEAARLLSRVRLYKQLRVAWDRPQDEEAVLRGLEVLRENGIPMWKVMIYVLIGYNTSREEDLHRVTVIDRLGADPFVMPYNRTDPYQRDFARWVNHRAIFKSCDFTEYRRSKKV